MSQKNNDLPEVGAAGAAENENNEDNEEKDKNPTIATTTTTPTTSTTTTTTTTTMTTTTTKLGSGLASFFHDLLPSKAHVMSQLYDTSLQDLAMMTEEEDVRDLMASVGCCELLLPPSTSASTATTSSSTHNNNNNNNAMERSWNRRRQQTLQDYLTARTKTSRSRRRPEDADDDDSDPSEAESTAEMERGDEREEDEDERDESQEQPMIPTRPLESQTVDRLETQEMVMGTQDHRDGDVVSSPRHDDNTRKTRRKKKRRKITRVDETIMDVTKLEYVDLTSRTLNLTLCRVVKVWPIRSTRRILRYFSQNESDDRGPGRNSSSSSSNHHHHHHGMVVSVFPGPSADDGGGDGGRSRSRHRDTVMPRYEFRNFQEDGPAAVGHRYVVSMEVEQLWVPEGGGGGGGGDYDVLSNYGMERGSSVDGRRWPKTKKKRQQRMMIFFYDEYAKMVDRWMDDDTHQKRRNYVMKLSNVPARCIFPFAVDPRNWMDRQTLLEYCVCIGTENSITLTGDDESDDTHEAIRFDSDDLEIAMDTIEDTDVAVASRISTRVEAEAPSHELVLSKETIEVWQQQQQQSESTGSVIPARRRTTTSDGGGGGGGDGGGVGSTSTLKQAWVAHLQSRQQNEDPFNVGGDGTGSATRQSTARHQRDPSPRRRRKRQRQTQEERPMQGQGGRRQSSRRSATPAATSPPHAEQQQQQQQQQPGSSDQQKPSPDDEQQPPQDPVEPIDFEGDATRTEVDADAHRYTKLGDLKGILETKENEGRAYVITTINVHAVVMAFNAPHMTKRGEFIMEATLMDDTCTDPITLIMFRKTKYEFPNFAGMGDVIRIHRAELNEWNDVTQIVGKKPSSFVVVRKESEGWKGYPTAGLKFSFNDSDARRMQTLWRWSINESKTKSSIKAEYSFTLDELPNMTDNDEQHMKDKDTTVMVTGIYPCPEQPSGVNFCGLLRIWDGTGDESDPPLDQVQLQYTQQTQEKGGEPPPEAVEKVASLVKAFREENAADDDDDEDAAEMEIPMALCGRVANAVIWEPSCWTFIQQHVSVGTFIRIRNADVRKYPDPRFRSVSFHNKTWVTPLPENAFDVRAMIDAHDDRYRHRRDTNPKSALLPVVSSHQPRSTASGTGTTQLLPTGPEWGTGLLDLVEFEDCEEYSGIVRLDKLVHIVSKEDNTNDEDGGARGGGGGALTVELSDQSGSLVAYVSSMARQAVQASFDDSNVTDADRRVMANLHSFELDGEVLFMLAKISPPPGDHELPLAA